MMSMTVSEILAKDACFRYQLLSRMKADCDCYLGYGNRLRKYLWADDEEEQISLMKALWRSFPEKPEWLSWDAILDYERKMCPNSGLDTLSRTLEAVLEEQGVSTILLYRPPRKKAGADAHLDGDASVCLKCGQEPRQEGRVICGRLVPWRPPCGAARGQDGDVDRIAAIQLRAAYI